MTERTDPNVERERGLLRLVLGGSLGRAWRAMSPRAVAAPSRWNYARELATSMSMPAAVAMIEGGVAGVVAAKVFHATEFQIATITAAAMFANLTSFAWAHATRGRRKVPSIVVMMAATVACVGAIGLLPTNAAGAWALVALVVAARCLLVGIITVRSTVWRNNYPRTTRGRITGRLALMGNLMLFAVPTLGALLLDADERVFRLLYLLGAAGGLIGMIAFGGVRLRRERSLLRFERQPDARPLRHGDPAGPGIYEYDRPESRPSTGMIAVLRRDPLFRRYMVWQFIAGVSNMMVEPVLIFMAARDTESLAGGFFIGIMLTHGLPILLTVMTLPLWAGRLDRVHIARFRVEQAWLWTVSQVIMWIGAAWVAGLWPTIIILAVGRIVLGVARGGGVLAWNLGHYDFASREMATVYMGIHVTLTGVRGAFAPFLGMALFTGWDGFAGIGGHVFAVSALLSFVALVGFRLLEKQLRRLGRVGTIQD